MACGSLECESSYNLSLHSCMESATLLLNKSRSCSYLQDIEFLEYNIKGKVKHFYTAGMILMIGTNYYDA